MKITVEIAFLLGAAGLVAAVAPEPRAELQSEDLDSNYTMSLTTREEGHGRGRVICGNYANANYLKLNDLVYDMDNKDKDKEWTIDGGECNRVSCYDTTAIYVCNDNDHPITLKGKEISISLLYIRHHCCFPGPRTKTSDNFVNGQQFTEWGWNVNAGYGNCRDPVNIRPHMAGGWGVNPGNCPGTDLPDQPF